MKVELSSDPPENPTTDQIEKLSKGGAPPPEEEPDYTDDKLFAGKFKTQEDLEKGYLEAQQKISELTKTEPKEASSDDPAFSIKSEGGETPPTEPSKFDRERYEQEFISTGGFSDETLAELKAQNMPQEMIDVYASSLQGLKEARSSAILNMFGDQDRMSKVLQWANTNLSEAEIASIDAQANSSDMGTCEAAIKGLTARFDASPMGQTSIEGVTGGPTVKPFGDNHEMTEAMDDPRYKRSASYRAEIAARMAVT